MSLDRAEAVHVLMTVRERLCVASDNLGGLVDKAAASHATSEFARLSGKRTGVRLAISYVDEHLRDLLADASAS